MYIQHFRKTVSEARRELIIDDPFQQRIEAATELIRVRPLPSLFPI